MVSLNGLSLKLLSVLLDMSQSSTVVRFGKAVLLTEREFAVRAFERKEVYLPAEGTMFPNVHKFSRFRSLCGHDGECADGESVDLLEATSPSLL